MTKLELLRIVLGRARANGFEFRRWYVTRLGLPWISTEAALTALDAQRRYYSLLFSHDFARSFWKPGEDITFTIAASSFERIMPDGSVGHVNRKPYIRRSARRDAWRYHLQQMALAEEPLRYIRKYLHVAEEMEEDPAPEIPTFDSQEHDDLTSEPSRKLAVMPSQAPSPASLDQSPTAHAPIHAPKLHVASQNAGQSAGQSGGQTAGKAATPRGAAAKRIARPLPTDLPHFLRRSPGGH